MTSSVPRVLLSRGKILLHHHPYRTLQTSSKSLAAKPIVLEKPDKFNPPSHSARLPKRHGPPRLYGGDLSETQRQAQKTRKYPHMMPEEGTFMFWFLSNKWIHLWICLGTLTCLAVFVNLETFNRTSPVAHLLPHRSYFLAHPLDYLSEYLTIYKMHIDCKSKETAEKRAKRTEDIQKRDRYRKAHGIEDTQNVWGFGKRLQKVEKEGDDQAVVEGSTDGVKDGGEGQTEMQGVRRERRRRPVKRWFGIWE